MKPTSIVRTGLLLAGLFILGSAAGFAMAAEFHQISQIKRDFTLREVEIHRGDSLRFINEDAFLHQIYISSPSLTFDSAEQPPGQTIDVQFSAPGTYVVLCHIHPKMHLTVQVR
jgi:plastocyanin